MMAEKTNRLFFVLVVLVSLVAVAIFFQPAVEDRLAPETVAAWVAIEVEGSEVAEVGQVSLELGTQFRLYAVLEARGRGDEPVYYTEAKTLRIDDREIPSDQLRTWQRSRPVKVRWFTVEGRRPFVKLEEGAGLESFELTEFARSDWPLAWTIGGEIDAANDNHLASLSVVPRQRFGTQRFHVRVEVYQFEDDLLPLRKTSSWGAEDLLENVDRFPTVEILLPGPLAPASRVFGLTQLHLPVGDPELQSAFDDLARKRLAFSHPSVVRDLLEGAGLELGELEWESLDLDGSAPWGGEGSVGPRPGDFVRVGDRLVVLYEDHGDPGVVDYADWCFDYVQGASVRALGDVFSGEGLSVEWAALSAGE